MSSQHLHISLFHYKVTYFLRDMQVSSLLFSLLPHPFHPFFTPLSPISAHLRTLSPLSATSACQRIIDLRKCCTFANVKRNHTHGPPSPTPAGPLLPVASSPHRREGSQQDKRHGPAQQISRRGETSKRAVLCGSSTTCSLTYLFFNLPFPIKSRQGLSPRGSRRGAT